MQLFCISYKRSQVQCSTRVYTSTFAFSALQDGGYLHNRKRLMWAEPIFTSVPLHYLY